MLELKYLDSDDGLKLYLVETTKAQHALYFVEWFISIMIANKQEKTNITKNLGRWLISFVEKRQKAKQTIFLEPSLFI